MARSTIIGVISAFALFLPSASAVAGEALQIEKLKVLARTASAEQEYACTLDRVWCVSRALGDDVAGALSVLHMENGDLRWLGSIPLSAPESSAAEDADDAEYAPWRSIVRFTPAGAAEIALIGVTQTQNVMYSGGGASITRLNM